MTHIKATPVSGSVAAGIIASLCCGGSLVFASIGLGTSWSLLGLSKYIPQALAVGAIAVVAINYVFYRRAAERVLRIGGRNVADLRRGMFLSAFFGLAAMSANFLFMEWLNHAVIDPQRFLVRPEFGDALIPGVPNLRLFYALAAFAALALLWALPFPRRDAAIRGASGPQQVLRVGVFAVTATTVAVLAAGTIF